MKCIVVHSANDTHQKTVNTRQTGRGRGGGGTWSRLVTLRIDHVMSAPIAVTHRRPSRQSRKRTSVTNNDEYPKKRNGKPSHSSNVCGPNRRSKRGTSSHHGERNTSLKYGNSGLSKWVYSVHIQGPSVRKRPTSTARPKPSASRKPIRKTGRRRSSAAHRPTAYIAAVSFSPLAIPHKSPAATSVRQPNAPSAERLSTSHSAIITRTVPCHSFRVVPSCDTGPDAVIPIKKAIAAYSQRSRPGTSAKSTSRILPRKKTPMPAGSPMTNEISGGGQ